MAKRTASVCASIPEELITEAIERQMVEALGDKKALIDGVVKAALEEKDSRSYGRETVFGVMLKSMIREKATAVFKAWMEKHSREIAAAIRTRLDTQESTFIDEIVQQIASESERALHVSVELGFPES